MFAGISILGSAGRLTLRLCRYSVTFIALPPRVEMIRLDGGYPFVDVQALFLKDLHVPFGNIHHQASVLAYSLLSLVVALRNPPLLAAPPETQRN